MTSALYYRKYKTSVDGEPTKYYVGKKVIETGIVHPPEDGYGYFTEHLNGEEYYIPGPMDGVRQIPVNKELGGTAKIVQDWWKTIDLYYGGIENFDDARTIRRMIEIIDGWLNEHQCILNSIRLKKQKTEYHEYFHEEFLYLSYRRIALKRWLKTKNYE